MKEDYKFHETGQYEAALLYASYYAVWKRELHN